jgi:nucleoside-diphosphate-sugar epimerase
MAVIVTGPPSRLARRLIEALRNSGLDVVAEEPGASGPARGGLSSSDRADVESAAPTSEAAIHVTPADASSSRSRIVAASRIAARAAGRRGLSRAIFVSHLAAAGPLEAGTQRRDEGIEEHPQSPLGLALLEAERAFAAEVSEAGVEPTILRLGDLLDAEDPGFMASMIDAVLEPDWRALAGAWHQHRYQPLALQDAVDAILGALEGASPGVFNITDGSTPTVGDLWNHVAACLRRCGVSVPAPPKDFAAAPPAAGATQALHAFGRAHEDWGFAPQRNVVQQIRAILEARGHREQAESLPHLDAPLKVLLCNTPTDGPSLSRDMNGGLGFVHDNVDRFPPLALSWMAAHLEQLGWPCEILDGSLVPHSAGDLCSFITWGGFDAVVCEVNLPTFENDLLFLRTLRRGTRARIAARTVIRHRPFIERLLREGLADLVLVGECDLTIDRILVGDDPRGTARLVGGELAMVPEDKLQDLDRLPIPARHLLDNRQYRYTVMDGEGGFTLLQSSRGCPYSCGYYCPYPAAQGKAWRARSPAHVLAEIEDCLRLGLERILFRDATFTLDRKRTVEICELIIDRALPVRWWCETRFNCLDPDLLALMARAGCQGMNFGLESGDDDVLRAGAKQGVDVRRIRTILEAAAEVGIRSHLLIAVGLPQETRASIFNTYRLIGELPAWTVGVTAVTPMPGTELWDDAEARDWVLTHDWSLYGGNNPTMRTDNLSGEDIHFAARMIYEHFEITRPGAARPEKIAAHEARMRSWVEHGLTGATPRVGG